MRWRARALLGVLSAMALTAAAPGPPAGAVRRVAPVLAFPEPGLDDPAAYEGYETRLYRDSAGNAVQVYIDRRSGRVVHVWADAVNESIGFTVRDAVGRPVDLTWGDPEAEVATVGRARFVQTRLTTASPVLHVGHFLLGSMRKERDFQYHRKHLEPFDAEPFHEPELLRLTENLRRLPPGERRRHLALLRARGPDELRRRLDPGVTSTRRGPLRVARIEQTSFDGRNRLALELGVDARRATVEVAARRVVFRSLDGRPLDLVVRVWTDAPTLTPLRATDIFNADFWAFYEQTKATDPERFRRVDRHVRGMELLCYREKLMAGLPNFATYFGRDTLMTALMMEPLWSVAMLEHAVESVLRKVDPSGQVSHEESLGGQAIRENAERYNQAVESGRLADARAVLSRLQEPRENYRMVDDDFQLPVLVARYLGRADVPAERKRAFLMGSGGWRLVALLRNLRYVVDRAAPYAEAPRPQNLVGFPPMDGGRWFPGSWRDSTVGYANGRFAMDVNTVWVPRALEAVGAILAALRDVGLSVEDLEGLVPDVTGARLMAYARDSAALRRAVRTWQGAVEHFRVSLPASEVRRRVQAKLAWLPEAERAYWERVLAGTDAADRDLEFLALSLDAEGRPIPVVHTDVATRLFLEDFAPDEAVRLVEGPLRPYPVGLFVEGLGPLVANDAYAAPDVWEAYRRDPYHSPRVVWGREVNLLLLGLARQVQSAFDAGGRLRDPRWASAVCWLEAALRRVRSAVEASGLKHAELWTYRIEDDRLRPVRYGTGSDVQLWNLTDLAVQFQLRTMRDTGCEIRGMGIGRSGSGVRGGEASSSALRFIFLPPSPDAQHRPRPSGLRLASRTSE